MSFMKIYKGKKSLSVPAGAYLKQYAPNGWTTTDEDSKDEMQATDKSVSPTAANSDLEDLQDAGNDASNTASVPVEDDDVEYVDPEELAKRPVSELDREELEILAEYKGLNPKEYTSVKQLKGALKSLE